MNTKSLSVKLPLMVAAILLVTIVIIVAVALISLNGLATSMTDQLASSSNQSFAKFLEDYRESALKKAEIIASVQEVYEHIAEGDVDGLCEVIAELGADVDFVTVTDKDGIVLGRSYTDKKGDSITNQKVISTALSTGKGTSAIEPGTAIPLAVRASAVIKDESGNLAAVVSCGYDLSNLEHVDKIKELSGTEVTLFADNIRLSTTLVNDKGERPIGTEANPDIAEMVLNKGQDYTGRVDLFGGTYEVYYSPLIADGQTLGMLFSGINIDDTLAYERNVILIIITAAILALLISMIIMVLASRNMIIKPLTALSMFFHKASATGNIIVTPEEERELQKYMENKDEIGQMMKDCGAFIDHIIEVANEVEFIANGDLTIKIQMLSENDTMGKSLKRVVDSLSQMFSEINAASSQVTLGAGQIANSSQSLAQGSTEQASAVEELSMSINEISEKSKENANMAGNAANMSNNIRNNAEKGNEQMNHLMQAVTEISEAGQSIGKIIKTIDDIAFQTNILALNAAVEAARAGQHGKGFAVVAEEVRNLAGKSAEAAKDTASMIENTIEKSNLGLTIATDTAASLKEIVEGIEQSAEVVQKIAQSSNEQTDAILHINAGIDQVSQVVQQNSATAQESAAASEEMSGQASLLQQLVHKFKLKR